MLTRHSFQVCLESDLAIIVSLAAQPVAVLSCAFPDVAQPTHGAETLVLATAFIRC